MKSVHTRGGFGRRLIALPLVLALFAAACGGDDDASEPDQASSSEPSGEATETTVAADDAPEPDETGSTVPTSDAPATTVSDADAPVAGGTLTLLHRSDIVTTWDTARARPIGQGEGIQAIPIYDVLFGLSLTGEITPQLALSAEPNDDATVWTITLRDGVTFTDGTAFDAEAVKFNMLRHQDPELASWAASSANMIDSIEVLDAVTLEVHLLEPFGQFPSLLATHFAFIGSPTAMQNDPEGFATNPVGAGPFMLKQWNEGDSVVYVRNNDYWNAPLPYLDELVIKGVTDETARLSTVQTGGAQMAFTAASTMFEQITTTDGIDVTRVTGNGARVLALNQMKPPFDDIRAREALDLAFDWDEFLDYLDGGVSTFASSLFVEGSEYQDPNRQFTSNDPARAQELFNELAAEAGGVFKFTFVAPQAVLAQCEAFQTYLNSTYENVQVEVEPIANADFFTRRGSGTYEALFSVMTITSPVPTLSDRFMTEGPANYTGYSNPVVDDLFEQLIRTTDHDESIELMGEIEGHLIEDHAVFMFIRPEFYYYQTDDVQGIEFTTDGLLRYEVLWLAES